MDKKRIEMVITAVLVVVLMLVWANSCRVLKNRAAVKGDQLSAAISSPVSNKFVPTVIKDEEAEWRQLLWVRCPFSGKSFSASQESALHLKLDGIVWDVKDPVAMINGRIFKKGNMIGGNKIVDIKSDRVVINDGNKDFEIKVGR